VDVETNLHEWALACEVQSNVLVYDGSEVAQRADDSAYRTALLSEWAHVLENGPGVFVIRTAIADRSVVDRATHIFTDIIDQQHASGAGGADHFAKPGANDRVWNSLQKHLVADPVNFARYYGSAPLAFACEAWLGAGYQVTAQVNRVNPGGAAQVPHRDYHLGFMNPEESLAWPGHVHRLSPYLTLQGAVSHTDMSVDSGPTMFLPYSQRFTEGYVAYSRPEFQQWFADHYVQIPLAVGDAVFFNPALMHGAGTNRTADVLRMANLLQVASAFGRAMESVDRVLCATTLYPVLLDLVAGNNMTSLDAQYAIAAAAEGYAFPSNMDTDGPVGGLAPRSQAVVMADALSQRMQAAAFCELLNSLEARRRP
jgi:ectoine hydroxylase-related dioxygenase (phytanoyl-CoA dioxygenase family)